uniref:Porphobilinogen deaminase, chloroplastic n=1 Tax=Erythrolobus madagascarensis TaxID=708628 RepID=A0A7S0T6W0_9RHOD|mmetsp:Transcript_334/g.637  ORF Transcript_334/g.637 Transcript_334/m.637 type:complete len:383 (+) Transcript_334:106-1254(+)|eukprot:CAMPEP_0185852880 /NCGR_PEP_ID=MMETSP1354-20130828/16727_1 /TAXON_ID=708628 /ORGANISM="Erythrolobus madagascarensis, Strain CCMP3276" /LENGTH=382 /DNA_ID=CAMNT_0028554239 /DNA_START=95 /DNA_END=1243 /DNA_ORIENTATION=+
MSCVENVIGFVVGNARVEVHASVRSRSCGFISGSTCDVKSGLRLRSGARQRGRMVTMQGGGGDTVEPRNPDALVVIGTRGSPLALWQAHETERCLKEAFPELQKEGAIQISVINTSGDRFLETTLADMGGKGLFTKEIDAAQLRGDVDIAVHSMKDVPTWLPDGICLPCMLPREDTRDVLLSGKAKSISELPDGAVIGSASLRRKSQLLATNPTFKVVNFRGNLQTRIRKLNEGVVDATMLACAGLSRMGMMEHASQIVEWDEMLPAVAQGAIGITCRSGDEKMLKYLAALNHEDTLTCVSCERAFLEALDGSCRTPIAGQAWLESEGERIEFRGLVARPDGSEVHKVSRSGKVGDAEKIGREAGAELKAKIGSDFFDVTDE